MGCETSIIDKVEHLSEALEGVSDLSIEYSDILNSNIILEKAVSNGDSLISSILSQQVSARMISVIIATTESGASLKLAISLVMVTLLG